MKYVIYYDGYGEECKLLTVADNEQDAKWFVEQEYGQPITEWHFTDASQKAIEFNIGDAGWTIHAVSEVMR